MKSKEIKKTFSHISYKIGMMIFSICFLVFTFLKNFNENMTPKLLYLAELNIILKDSYWKKILQTTF